MRGGFFLKEEVRKDRVLTVVVSGSSCPIPGDSVGTKERKKVLGLSLGRFRMNYDRPFV